MNLELRLPPPAVTLICMALMYALASLLPLASFALPGRLFLALGLPLAGLLIALSGVAHFRQQRTTINPLAPQRASSLVTGGIYRFSRNPMYLGMLLLLGGWACYLANGVSALLLPAFVFYMNRFQIQPEERALSAIFGEDFVRYTQSVRRWL